MRNENNRRLPHPNGDCYRNAYGSDLVMRAMRFKSFDEFQTFVDQILKKDGKYPKEIQLSAEEYDWYAHELKLAAKAYLIYVQDAHNHPLTFNGIELRK